MYMWYIAINNPVFTIQTIVTLENRKNFQSASHFMRCDEYIYYLYFVQQLKFE